MRQSFQTPLSAALMPELNREAQFLNQAIQLDSLALKQEADRFSFSEAKKDAARRDYEWNKSLELDQMEDNLLGGILSSIYGIDPNDPEARNKINGVMQNVPPEMYGNSALTGLYGNTAKMITASETERLADLDYSRKNAMNVAGQFSKDTAMTTPLYEFGKILRGAKTQEEIDAATGQIAEIGYTNQNSRDRETLFTQYSKDPEVGDQINKMLGLPRDSNSKQFITNALMYMGKTKDDLLKMEEPGGQSELAQYMPEIAKLVDERAGTIKSINMLSRTDANDNKNAFKSYVLSINANAISTFKAGKGKYVYNRTQQGVTPAQAESEFNSYEKRAKDSATLVAQIETYGNEAKDAEALNSSFKQYAGLAIDLDGNGGAGNF